MGLLRLPAVRGRSKMTGGAFTFEPDPLLGPFSTSVRSLYNTPVRQASRALFCRTDRCDSDTRSDLPKTSHAVSWETRMESETVLFQSLCLSTSLLSCLICVWCILIIRTDWWKNSGPKGQTRTIKTQARKSVIHIPTVFFNFPLDFWHFSLNMIWGKFKQGDLIRCETRCFYICCILTTGAKKCISDSSSILQ